VFFLGGFLIANLDKNQRSQKGYWFEYCTRTIFPKLI